MRRFVVVVEGRSVLVSAHAIARYAEHVRPGADVATVVRELERLLAAHGVWGERPAWVQLERVAKDGPAVDPERETQTYVLLTDDIAFPVVVSERGPRLATCKARGSKSAEARARRKEHRRRVAATRRDARNHKRWRGEKGPRWQ